MNILFINAGRRCELIRAFRNALNARGGGAIYATDIMEFAPALSMVDGFKMMPHSSDETFPESFCAYCSDMAIDLVIPTIDPDLVSLSKWRDVIKTSCPDVTLLLSSDTSISLSSDKRLSKTQFEAAGALVPPDCSPDDANLTFPLFLKPAHGSASMGVHKINSKDDLARLYPTVKNPMLEPYINGPEVTVDVLCDFEGNPLSAVPRRRMAVRGGEVCRGIVERNTDLEDLAKKMAVAFSCTGPVTVQFRVPEPGAYYATEINARMGGGLPLTIAAGADWPGWILDLCNGKPPAVDTPIEDGLVMSRYDESFFISTKKTEPARPNLIGIDTVIFDLDDTLYREKDFVVNGFHAVAETVYRDFGVDVLPHLITGFENGIRHDAFGRCLCTLGIEADEAYLKRLVNIYRDNRLPLKPFLDSDVIDQLKAAGMKIGLVTDGWLSVQKAKVDALGIESLFDAIVYTDALGGRDFWKPSPAGLNQCLNLLDADAGSAVYIADNPHKDFQAASAAGMRSIRIARPGGEHSTTRCPASVRCDATITGLHQLKSVFSL